MSAYEESLEHSRLLHDGLVQNVVITVINLSAGGVLVVTVQHTDVRVLHYLRLCLHDTVDGICEFLLVELVAFYNSETVYDLRCPHYL